MIKVFQVSLLWFLLGNSTFTVTAQHCKDNPFSSTRILVNDLINLAEWYAPRSLLNEYENLRTYTLCEPEIWTSKRHHVIKLSENPNMMESSTEDSILSFPEILNKAISEHDLWVFKDKCFDDAYDNPKKLNIDFENSDYLLKTYFYFDLRAKVFRKLITGIHVLQGDSIVANIYYPQLKRSLLINQYVRFGDEKIRYVDFFNEWRFLSNAVSEEIPYKVPPHNGYSDCENDINLEQQSEYDAYISAFLVSKEIESRLMHGQDSSSIEITSYIPQKTTAIVTSSEADNIKSIYVHSSKNLILEYHLTNDWLNGEFKEFYPNSNQKQIGQFDMRLRVGEWKSYHSNGKLRSIRQYNKGILDGLQVIFHPNGNKYMEYEMDIGEYHGIHREYYKNEKLKNSGQLESGFIIGNWKHSVYITDRLKQYALDHEDEFEFSIEAVEDNYLDYEVNYSYGPPNERAPLNKNLKREIGVVE